MNPVVTKLAATVAAGGAAVAARKAVEFGWREFRHEEPPTMRDGEGDRQLRDLMLWAAIVTAAVVLAKKLAASTTVKVLGDQDE
jgi:hypothetical protein